MDREYSMSDLSKRAENCRNPENLHYLIKTLNLVENEEDLMSLLLLPEMKEENNLDLPFHVKGRFRVNACGKFLQALSNESLAFFREDQFVADWIEKLTRTPGIHCFDGKVGVEFTYPDGKHLYFSLNRNEGASTLSVDLDGKSGGTLEVWKQGLLIQSFNWSPAFEPQPLSIENGTALYIRRDAKSEGVEILVDEGEFGKREWKAVLAGLCIQGSIQQALQVLESRVEEIFDSKDLGHRFLLFLKNMKSFIKQEGYVLMPVPAVRGCGVDPEDHPVLPSCLSDAPGTDVFHEGWHCIGQRDYRKADEAFSRFYSQAEREWSLPLEGLLANYLESATCGEISQKDRLRATTFFWEKIFNTIDS